MKRKERKIVQRCIRRAFAWNARVEVDQQKIGQQYLELPRAICDPIGNPNKRQKSYTTKWLEKRYTSIVSNMLPNMWVAHVVVLEGMFIINTSPLSTHKNMCEYARFLLRRFVTPHFSNGSMEIHIVLIVQEMHLTLLKHLSASEGMKLHSYHLIISMCPFQTYALCHPNGVSVCYVDFASDHL